MCITKKTESQLKLGTTYSAVSNTDFILLEIKFRFGIKTLLTHIAI